MVNMKQGHLLWLFIYIARKWQTTLSFPLLTLLVYFVQSILLYHPCFFEPLLAFYFFHSHLPFYCQMELECWTHTIWKQCRVRQSVERLQQLYHAINKNIIRFNESVLIRDESNAWYLLIRWKPCNVWISSRLTVQYWGEGVWKCSVHSVSVCILYDSDSLPNHNRKWVKIFHRQSLLWVPLYVWVQIYWKIHITFLYKLY